MGHMVVESRLAVSVLDESRFGVQPLFGGYAPNQKALSLYKVHEMSWQDLRSPFRFYGLIHWFCPCFRSSAFLYHSVSSQLQLQQKMNGFVTIKQMVIVTVALTSFLQIRRFADLQVRGDRRTLHLVQHRFLVQNKTPNQGQHYLIMNPNVTK